MIDPTRVPQGGQLVLVMLKDGTQLEGESIVLTHCYFIAGTVFQDWQVETLEEVT